jgi:hypothetical protein
MNGPTPKEKDHTETFRKWVVKNVTCGVAGLCLGVLLTIILGRLILFADFPDPIQKILGRFYNSPYDLSGNYYYITTTQNIPNLPVRCNGNSRAKVIAGFVNVQHKRRINDQSISLHGERIYCISIENEKSKLKRVKWNSTWAFIHDGKLYAKISIGDNKEGYIEGTSVFDDNNGFSAQTVYVWEVEESQRKKDLGRVVIEFSRCKSSKCKEELEAGLSKHQI